MIEIYLIIGIIEIIVFLILFFAILNIRENTKEIKQILRSLVKWQIEHDKNDWDNYKEQIRKEELAVQPILAQERILKNNENESE